MEIERHKAGPTNEPYTFTRFMLEAAIEKIEHRERSRSKGRKRPPSKKRASTAT